MLTQAPKGTKDMLPAKAYQWHAIEENMRKLADEAGYREIRTPVFEHTELFLRGVGDTTDIVQKEMYTFLDKGKRSITLKPEGTAGAVRALIENSLYADALPIKMYYLNAPIFRYEAPQSGRYREHHQFGMECFGAQHPSVDAELITSTYRLFEGFGVKNIKVHINSIGCPKCRPAYVEKLKEYIGQRKEGLCNDCQNRYEKNPLRVLDCKQEGCQILMKDAPVMLDMLCEECQDHFNGLQGYLKAANLDFVVDTRIVRGLDYYTKTVFELITKTQKGEITVCGGGRYDGLVQELGGPQMPAAGFGMGMERLLMLLEDEGLLQETPGMVDVFIASMGEEGRLPAFTLADTLRKQNIRCDFDHMCRSLKAQFKYANKIGVRVMAILGEEELQNNEVTLRNMQTREEIRVALDKASEQMTIWMGENVK